MFELTPTVFDSEALERLQRWSLTARGAYSQQSERAWRCDLKTFGPWCAQRGLMALPAAPETVAEFLRSESQAGRAVSTIQRRAATIALVHRAAGLPDPNAAAAVKLALRAIVRERGDDQRQARGLTQREADTITGRVETRGRLRDLRDLAVMLVGRDLLARASELVSLTVEGITWADNGSAQAALRRRKTSSETLPCYLGVEAAGALKRWLTASCVASGPIFRAITKGGKVKCKAIGERDVTRIVKALAGDAYSAHSLRVGMAQDLVEKNLSLPAVMQAGGWRTAEMVARYTQRIDVERGAVAQYHAGKRRS
jgi:site-specific recombinase XerD